MTAEQLDSALASLLESGVRSVHLQFVDLFGVLKSVNVPVRRFADVAVNGEWFDGSAVDGFARVLERDMFLLPDLGTLRLVPWERDSRDTTVARVMCNLVTPAGDASPGDSRAVLRRVLERAAAAGLAYDVAPEVEFFLFDTMAAANGHAPERASDSAGYFDQTRDTGARIREEIVDALTALDVDIEGSHHEVSGGQHEIGIALSDALGAADAVVLLRHSSRAVAARHGLQASFMPKPLDSANGSGMHTHQVLRDRVTHDDLFHDAEDPYGLSPMARHFVAGQLAHASAMTALTASTVNSYKRLISGFEAPTHVCWAHSSRGAMIRVPQLRRGARSTRLELRSPDAACNPYLAFAAMLAAGLDGMECEMPLMPPVEEEGLDVDAGAERRYVRSLPGSLVEALDALVEDDVLLDALGSTMVERFVDAKRIEWEQFRAHVSDWEVKRYLSLH
ncbi:MAG: glutamine synthetase family protein [Candidatus Dormibacteria bacterium]